MIAAYGFIKLSILYYYRRLFVTQKNSIFDIVTKVSIGAVIAWTLVFFFRFVFYCGTHFAANWYGIYNSEVYCPTGDASNEALIISEMITNIFVICLPLPIVSRSSQQCSIDLTVIGLEPQHVSIPQARYTRSPASGRPVSPRTLHSPSSDQRAKVNHSVHRTTYRRSRFDKRHQCPCKHRPRSYVFNPHIPITHD